MSLQYLNPNSAVDTSRLDEDTRQDYLLIFLVLPIICLARFTCEKIGRFIFLNSESAQKMRGKNLALKLAVKKFEEATWKCVYYAFIAIYGLVFISWEPFLRHTVAVYPNIVPRKVSWYYVIQISFYIWMTVCLIWDVRKRDFYQMTAHHFTTLILLFSSYSYQFTNGGALLMLLMDIADPFLEFAKICKYLGNETGSTISFIFFFLAFIILRLVVYPMYTMYPCIFHTWELALYLDKVWLYYLIDGGMCVLCGLNIYWAVLIVNCIVAKFKLGTIEDSRSDEEVD